MYSTQQLNKLKHIHQHCKHHKYKWNISPTIGVFGLNPSVNLELLLSEVCLTEWLSFPHSFSGAPNQWQWSGQLIRWQAACLLLLVHSGKLSSLIHSWDSAQHLPLELLGSHKEVTQLLYTFGCSSVGSRMTRCLTSLWRIVAGILVWSLLVLLLFALAGPSLSFGFVMGTG